LSNTTLRWATEFPIDVAFSAWRLANILYLTRNLIMSKRSVLGLVCIAIALGGFMSQSESNPSAGSSQVAGSSADQASNAGDPPASRPDFRSTAVRYQVKDVDRSVAFYTEHLGFTLTQKPAPAFASVSNGSLTLWLSGPKSSGSRPMPDGRTQEPGGWNRVVLQVDDLAARVAALQKTSIRFRNEIEVGPGGKQIQIEDPDGNPIELFETAVATGGASKDRP
jgi:glyoxylase I family protein